MNDSPWRRYVSLFTTTPIDIDSSELVAALEDAFRKSGVPGPYNTEINAPNNKKGAPVVKVETSNGTSGVWIGNHLIFMPVGSDEDLGRLFSALAATKLAALGLHSYSLNSARLSKVAAEQARQSTNPEVIDLLNNKQSQEFSKNVTKQISDTLTAKDVITISRGENDDLSIDMTIAIDSAEMSSGQTVGAILPEINFEKLKAHEDEIKQQADSIIIGR